MKTRMLCIVLLAGVVLGMTGMSAEASPLSFGALMRSVKVYIQQDNWERAHELLLEAIEKKPDDVDANYYLGYYYGLEGDYVQMDEFWAKAMASGKGKNKDIDRNRDVYFRNNFNDGIAAYNEAVELLNDEDAKEDRDELFAEAVDGFKVAMLVKPDDLRSIKPLSNALMVLGEVDEAEKLFLAVLEREANDVGAHQGLGEIYTKRGTDNDDKAVLRSGVEHYEAALQENPDDSSLMRHVIAGYLGLDEPDKANEIFKVAIEKNPKDPDLRMTYAEILDQQGKSEEAIAEFEEVIKLSPDNTSAIVKIAQFFMEKQKYAEAIPYWEKFVELQPEIMGAWHNLGICYGQSGQSEKALEAVKKAESLK